MAGRLSLVFLLFYVFLHYTRAEPTTISRCSGLASMATPPAMSALAGTWYVYVTGYKAWVYELKCMTCQVKASGEMQCIMIRKIKEGFLVVDKYEYITAKLTYNAATKLFKATAPGVKFANAEFAVTKYNKDKASIVVALCNHEFRAFEDKYDKVEIGLGMGGDLSKLTDVTTGKTDVEYKTCFKVAFDFAKKPGVERGAKATGARNLEMFKDKGNGETCVASVQCTVTDQECKISKCTCVAGKTYDAVKKACVGAKKHGEACTLDGECGGGNQKCTGGKCACKDTAALDAPNKKCLLKTKYDQPCTINGQCADLQQQCSAAKKCECKPSFKYDAAKKKCLAVAAYNAACESNVQCTGAEQECKTKCLCKATAVYDGTSKTCLLKKEYDAACTVTAQCHKANQECKKPDNKCKCTATHVYDATSKGCLKEKKYNEVCTASAQCNGGDQECKGGKCACIAGATYDAGLKKCLGKKTHGQQCAVNSQCSESNQICTGSPKKTCTCNTEYVHVAAKGCLKKAGNKEACEVNEQCVKVAEQECKNKACACKAGKIFAVVCGSVPKGYVESKSEPGNYLRRIAKRAPIKQSVDECKSHVPGLSDIVQIKSQAKNTEVQNMLKNRGTAWIGVAQTTDGKTYVRPDKSTFIVNDKAFQPWYNGDSKDFGLVASKDSKNCVYMYPYDGKWEDADSTELHGVVCEIRPK